MSKNYKVDCPGTDLNCRHLEINAENESRQKLIHECRIYNAISGQWSEKHKI